MVLTDSDSTARDRMRSTCRLAPFRRSSPVRLLVATCFVAAGLDALPCSAATESERNAGARDSGKPPLRADSSVRIVAPTEESALVVDAPHQEYTAKPGERSCAFRFEVTNASERELLINQVRTSCGCAVAQLPAQPWHLAAGASGTVLVTVDLRAMSGVVVRTATIDLPTSFKLLTMKITVPPTAKKSS